MPSQAFGRAWVSKPSADRAAAQEVHITGLKIPFWSLVFLMVKVAIASILALLILGVLVGLLPLLLRAALSLLSLAR